MKIRYGDKPQEDFKDNISYYEGKAFDASLKVDGWRTTIVKDKSAKIVSGFGSPDWGQGRDKSLFFLSSRGMKKGGPTRIPVSKEIVDSVEALDLPDLTSLDSEWMARRTIGECLEKLFLLDCPYKADLWLGSETYLVRREWLLRFTEGKLTPVFDMPETVSSGFAEFFQKSTTLPWTEGIVLKGRTSKLKGGVDKPEHNALWIKIKWRSGDTGREVYKEI